MSKISAILKAGLIAGTLDICAAMISVYARTGKGPALIFRYIARGAFGEAAKTGGGGYIIAGLLFHYLIAFTFTIFFFLIYPLIKKWASKYIIPLGLLYGIFAWCIMNLMIVPSSRIVITKTPAATDVIREMLILMFCIGLPIAIVCDRYFRKRKTISKVGV